MTARDCPSNLMNAMRSFKYGICISSHWVGAITAILFAEKKVSIISFSGSISCLIVGKIAQFRFYNVHSHCGFIFVTPFLLE